MRNYNLISREKIRTWTGIQTSRSPDLERQIRDLEVRGSNPCPGSIFFLKLNFYQ